ncbi:MAG: hypothetical protein UY16_C0007G0024 [Candidatus Gottesmanbacteria bacterium GW2011_GWA2_47_9]|uniref:Uncharacterized protein n=1 Tax=Candidatus Gottesmanbacteria bacterium GW2011_GWA2_47_9 TaxID=1618445 RepID=A0A0G1WDN2_9BACT|nr:MAG: hypothetical protein UY16_C0007G0024 [Candidatus Gottesmanbacteria bacterium GW2011_GWA2_47_9]
MTTDPSIPTTPAEPIDEGKDIHPLTPEFERLTQAYVQGINSVSRAMTPIHVDEIASRIAKFYEMVRKVVDWKEDNVLRRSAIERALKRTLFPKLSGVIIQSNVDTYRIAYTITADLIRGGHLANDEIPQEAVLTVENALKKYLYILEHAQFPSADLIPIKRKINFATFIIELAACEIEEILTNPVKERTLLQAMTESLTARIRTLPEGSISDEEKKTHTFIASCRTLFDLDDGFILYELIKFTYPGWSAPDAQLLKRLASEIPNLWLTSHHVLEHPISRQLFTISERIDTVFMLLGDVMDQYKEAPQKLAAAISDKTTLTAHLIEAYDKRYVSLKARLLRLAIFSTLSVFLSNWVTFFIIEVPLASWFYEGFNLFTAIIDFVVPTAVMFALVSIIRAPPAENIELVKRAVYQFLYADEKRKLYDVYLKRRRNPVIAAVMGVLYMGMMLGVLGGVGYVFYIAKLPITSVVFDTFTIALTFFAAVLIRNKAKELSVDDRMTVWEFLLDMVSVPIARIGSFLANKWKEYNIIAILFTFLIETPMVVVFDFIESWSQYLKERRSELH